MWGHQDLGGSALPARERPFQGRLARDPSAQDPDGEIELLGGVRTHREGRGGSGNVGEPKRGLHIGGGVREPVLGEDGIEGIPPCIARTREAVADFRELIDVHLPILLKLLQWEGPEVPETRHVQAGVRAVLSALHQGSGYIVGDVSPLSLLWCFLYLPNAPTPQVVSEKACGAALCCKKTSSLCASGC